MRTSSIARVLRAPRYPERLSAQQWHRNHKLRMYCLCTAILFDAIIWLGLRRADVNHAVADRFALINISLLTIDTAITLASFGRAALRKRWVIACLVILENITFIVWVQATGSLSSYFVLAGAILILAYRLAFDFTIAAVCAASLFVMHISVIVLELSGVLTPEALFLGPVSRVYELPLYQSMTIISIGSIYVLCFVGANAYVNKLREKEHALREVREEAAEIAEGARHGRLSGMVVADEYALGELLGRGGMGEIYIARRVSAEQTVAVKVLHPHLIESATALERFRREARAAERIRRHVCRRTEIGRTGAVQRGAPRRRFSPAKPTSFGNLDMAHHMLNVSVCFARRPPRPLNSRCPEHNRAPGVRRPIWSASRSPAQRQERSATASSPPIRFASVAAAPRRSYANNRAVHRCWRYGWRTAAYRPAISPCAGVAAGAGSSSTTSPKMVRASTALPSAAAA